jgi:sugar transferase (PEP-CTERM/EpsH1 system associated)
MLAPAWAAGVRRFVHSEHGLDILELDGKNFRYNALRRASRLVVDRYVTVSDDLKNWLHQQAGIPKARIERIYNGVDTDRFAPEGTVMPLPPGFVPSGALVVGAVGRFDTVKNQTALVAAVVRIVANHPELRDRLRLVLIGDGEIRREMEAMLSRAGIREIAWFGGLRSDVDAVYRALDIFVLPSLREGISNTLLEAMASGRPVIATRVGGTPEIVPDGRAGRLVEPTPQAIGTAILEYLGDAVSRRAHGASGRAHVLSRFSLRSMVSQYDRIYSGLTRSRSL